MMWIFGHSTSLKPDSTGFPDMGTYRSNKWCTQHIVIGTEENPSFKIWEAVKVTTDQTSTAASCEVYTGYNMMGQNAWIRIQNAGYTINRILPNHIHLILHIYQSIKIELALKIWKALKMKVSHSITFVSQKVNSLFFFIDRI